jgi:LysM repeat protein
MTNLRDEILRGCGAAGLVIVVVLSGFMIASSESEGTIQQSTPSSTPEATKVQVAIEVSPMTSTITITNTVLPTQTETATITQTFTPTITFTPTSCPIPTEWKAYTIKQGDTLSDLAKSRKSTVEAIQQGNCLISDQIAPGMILYLPPIPPKPTSTEEIEPEPCSQPDGWIVYTVQPGDTLYALAAAVGVSVQEIQQANCMGTSTFLEVGKTLYLPHQPTAPVPTSSGGIPTVIPIPIPTSGG